MPRPLHDSVVVITGASSGIGRATALAFARAGASVVLASRQEPALRALAAECERLGARALAVPTDTTDQEAVERLAQRAIEVFGRIDVWVNDAAVSLMSRFEEAPIDDYRRVIETDLFGYIYGARAALSAFRAQQGGTLINVGSIVSAIPQPYASAYVISKHGVRALGMCLRQELALDAAKDIHVCTVMPATIDTPFFQHAANYTGRAVKAMPPVYPAEQVADTIVSLAASPKAEVIVGGAGKFYNLLHAVAPGPVEKVFALQVDRTHLDSNRESAPTAGNLYEPMPELNMVSGGWRQESGSRLPQLVLGALALLPVVMAWRRGRQSRRRVPERPMPVA